MAYTTQQLLDLIHEMQQCIQSLLLYTELNKEVKTKLQDFDKRINVFWEN
jgi:hypothetical protein